jgi:hypothetical protein
MLGILGQFVCLFIIINYFFFFLFLTDRPLDNLQLANSLEIQNFILHSSAVPFSLVSSGSAGCGFSVSAGFSSSGSTGFSGSATGSSTGSAGFSSSVFSSETDSRGVSILISAGFSSSEVFFSFFVN